MASRKLAEQTDLQSYYDGRVEPLTKRLVDLAEALFGKESRPGAEKFEEHVEKRLHNGAKFVPRKSKPR
jgi:hypothetical protein